MVNKFALLWDGAFGYGLVSRTFHWLMAALFICQFIIAITLFLAGDGPVANMLWPVHQQLGFLLFLLAFVRGGWGILNITRRPHKHGLAGMLATIGHLLLYVLMLVVPALALLRASGDEYGFSVLGVEIFTPSGAENTALTAPGNAFHSLLGWVLLVVVAGHAGMAFFHHFVLRDDTLREMTGRTSRP